jgi:hypothetical protein
MSGSDGCVATTIDDRRRTNDGFLSFVLRRSSFVSREGVLPMTEVTPEQMAVYRETARRRRLRKQQELTIRRERALALVRQAATLLKEAFGAGRVVLFGSLARGGVFPFADKPQALIALLHRVFPAIRRVLTIEDNQSRQIVLIEWKYTESYGSTSLRIATSGTDRTSIYRPLFEREDCPLNKELFSDFDALFFEPFYQLMRQQFLAHEMERARELGVDVVSVLHIAPAHNLDFRKVTSPRLAELGYSVTDVWKRLVRTPDRFANISTEDLFGHLPVQQFPELIAWWEYITARYTWIR